MWKFFRRIFSVFILLSCVNANISIRTSLIKNNECFIAIDFYIKDGEHITAPIGIGKDSAPSIKLQNAEIIQTYWPKATTIKNHPDIFGFYKKLTLICRVHIFKLPIKYDIFYVSCAKACTPHQIKGEIQINNLIKQEEINNISNDFPLIKIIIFGFLGGLLLNIMPCVLPIISIKLLSIIRQATLSVKAIRHQCLLYSLGTISLFLSLGLALTKIHISRPEIGWGFYMQNPIIVFSLLLIFLLCSLHFFSIYQIRMPIPIIKSGPFINGMFGAISSAICVGPLLGVVIGSVILNNNILLAAILFLSIGIGSAFPFLLLTLFPKKVQQIPKLSPNWSKILTLIFGTGTLISCAWLLLVLSNQIDNILFIFSIVIIISVFLYSTMIFPTYKRLLEIIVCICIMCGYFLLRNNEKINWIEYQKEYLLSNSNQPIFINFTADWCLNCKVNDLLFNNNRIIDLFKKKNILPIRCDLTLRNKEISKLLQSYGTISIPFYVAYSADRKECMTLSSSFTVSELERILKNI